MISNLSLESYEPFDKAFVKAFLKDSLNIHIFLSLIIIILSLCISTILIYGLTKELPAAHIVFSCLAVLFISFSISIFFLPKRKTSHLVIFRNLTLHERRYLLSKLFSKIDTMDYITLDMLDIVLSDNPENKDIVRPMYKHVISNNIINKRSLRLRIERILNPIHG